MNENRKVLVLGVDAMDPRLTRKFVDEGCMPNTKKMLELGSARHDLVLLGGHPTVTPPMWCTLSTGAYASTHGLTCFWKQIPGKLDRVGYGLDSHDVLAEQCWYVTAEAGLKTLVFHWPGGSWPPLSDNPNLYMIDGTHPGVPSASACIVDNGFLLIAGEEVKEMKYMEKAASDSNVACVIEGLEAKEPNPNDEGRVDIGAHSMNTDPNGSKNIFFDPMDGDAQLTDTPYDALFSPIKPATGWEIPVPEGAKEFAIQFSKGAIRRIAMIYKDDAGKYSQIAIYKNKKATTPIVVLDGDKMYPYVWDETINRKGEKEEKAYRWMRTLDVNEDASRVVIYMGACCTTDASGVWYPKSFYDEITENVGHAPNINLVGGADRNLIEKCTMDSWAKAGDWYYDVMDYAIHEMDFEVIFSHYHNIDSVGHMIMKYQYKGHGNLTPEDYQGMIRKLYMQTDDYIGKFLYLIDEGWDILLVSDHGQVCVEHEAFFGLGEPSGTHVKLLEELGYTALVHDENGRPLREIDWENTRAVATRANHIWINLKGRDEHGIVDPEDKYALEDQLITDLYGYKHPETGQGIFSMVLRNRDAELVGLSGPRCGDIIYFLREGYNYDHADSLSTTWGVCDTSVSPIFIAAGPGIKKNFETERMIRQVDVTPTVCTLLGVRMPAQCEGAPVYQILE